MVFTAATRSALTESHQLGSNRELILDASLTEEDARGDFALNPRIVFHIIAVLLLLAVVVAG